jgi:cobalamin biosynthesis protein CobT
MKKDIVVIREAITKIVGLLTRQSIKVTQRGTKAYVQYSTKDGSIALVNLPYLPDDASEEFIAAVQGFLDHEVGHVLFTDPKVVVRSARMGSRVKNMANVLEDVYIEQKMTEAFAGSVSNLDAVRRFHVERMALPKIKEALAAGQPEVAAAFVAAIQFRAWGGQSTARNFMQDHPECAELVAPMAARIGEELIARVARLKSSDDALKLAAEIVKKLTPPPPPPPPPAPPAPPEKSEPEEGDGEPSDEKPVPGESGEGEPEKEDDDKPEAEDEGTTKTEADDSGKEREESSKTEEEGESGGDVEGEGTPAPTDENEDGDGDDRPEEDEAGESGGGAPGEPEPTADDGDDDGDDEPDDDEPDDDEPDDGEPDDCDGDGEPGDDAGSDPMADTPEEGADGAGESDDGEEGEPGGESSSDAEPSDEEGEGAKDDDGDKSETAGTTVDETGGDTSPDEPPEEEDLGAVFEEAHDFDEEISRVLSDAAASTMRTSDYKVFSNEWDRIFPAPMAENPASVGKLVDDVEHMVAGIQKKLERAMAAQDKVTWNPGQRRGRISPGALFRAATGDDRVFRKRYETKAKNTAVSLLVDCSGSMQSSDRIGTAGRAAYALSSTLERLKIHHEVLGYTTKESAAYRAAMKEEGTGIRYARLEALSMPVFKAFHERLTTDAKSRMAHLTERPRWLRENVDGECLQLAAHRLLQQRAERHVLIVLSDGSPACSGDYTALVNHLAATTKALEEKKVEVVGIGIQTSSVKHFYRRNLVLNNLSELPTTVVSQLADLLLAP